MLTTFCESFECPSGECEGCKLGKVWCDDPRCYPYCRTCDLPRHHESVVSMILFFMILIFTLIAIVLFVSYGPKMVAFHDGNVNNEYTYLTSFDIPS